MMDGKDDNVSKNLGSPENFPSLLKYIAAKSVTGFDTLPSPQGIPSLNSVPSTSIISDAIALDMPSATSSTQTIEPHHTRTVSISLPTSPTGFLIDHSVLLSEEHVSNATNGHEEFPVAANVVILKQPNQSRFHSQPMETIKKSPDRKFMNFMENQQRSNRLKDNRYDSFKTWSGKLERQISNLRGKQQEPQEINEEKIAEPEPVPAVDRYYDALEGPELDKLRASEKLILPEDKKWPFLLRFPISTYGICLGMSSQAILWKTLATTPSTKFLNVSPNVNLVLWCISLALMAMLSLIYALKIILYFEAVRREYHHPIRVNFFFAPWIACLFLAIGVPPSVALNLHAAVWYVLMAPILCLELKIYGQWMSGGQRRLSKVANPSNHLSIVGNFVGALLGASMGLKEGPIFFFAVGLAHYIVLFVTLYQRLPTNETLPKELHPVFFLFVAAPSVACMAWAKITGDFGNGSRIAYFVALFLYGSLAVRINFFRGIRFSIAWWAYTFPMTGASIATIRYLAEVKNIFTKSLAVALSGISTLTVALLFVSTIVHAFVLHDLFPNDISIAITERKENSNKELTLRSTSSSEDKDIEIGVSAIPEGR